SGPAGRGSWASSPQKAPAHRQAASRGVTRLMPVGTALTRLTDGIPQTAAPEPGQAPASPSGRDGRDHPATAVTTAVLLATAPAGDAPAATLPWGEGTIVDRLLDQLGELGVQSIVMI